MKTNAQLNAVAYRAQMRCFALQARAEGDAESLWWQTESKRQASVKNYIELACSYRDMARDALKSPMVEVPAF